MDISDDLIEAFGESIEVVRSYGFKSFSSEIPFIERTVTALDDIRVEVDANGGQSLWTITKQMHSTPRVEFFWPAVWETIRAELADLLFLVSLYEDQSGPVERRTSLSQSKFAGQTFSAKQWRSMSQRQRSNHSRFKWTIAPHQYFLLEELPEFRVTRPFIDATYRLRSASNSLRNYSFASDSWLPFIQRTEDMRTPIEYEWENQGKMAYKRHSHPGGTVSLYGYLKQLAKTNRGMTFERYDPIYHFYNDLFNSNVTLHGTSNPTLTDGGSDVGESRTTEFFPGSTSNDEKPFGIIQIVIYDGKLSDLDGQFYPDDPLYLGQY